MVQTTTFSKPPPLLRGSMQHLLTSLQPYLTLSRSRRGKDSPKGSNCNKASATTYLQDHCVSAEPKSSRSKLGSVTNILNNLGAGQCGTIYALPGTAQVLKLSNSAQKDDELFNDFCVHRDVKQAFDKLPQQLREAEGSISLHQIHVTTPLSWVNLASRAFWDEVPGLVPRMGYGLVSERIWGVPPSLKAQIVGMLCPRAIRRNKRSLCKKEENSNCLVRLYLGRHSCCKKSKNKGAIVTMRNFPLYRDQMERMGLDVKRIVETMAQALAVLHWVVGVDASDVEFVLGGSPPVSSQVKVSNQISDMVDKNLAAQLYELTSQNPTPSMWLLDFNQCKKFQKTEEGLKALVDGFWWNDPYYPHPADKALWDIFSKHYLEVSHLFEKSSMPGAFIKQITEKGQLRKKDGLFS